LAFAIEQVADLGATTRSQPRCNGIHSPHFTGSGMVYDLVGALLARAIRAAVEGIIGFHAVTDDLAPAVVANRR
jgi:hypothetical protein